MFVTDLGRTFCQADLLGDNNAQRGTFVLDSGGGEIYAWFAAGAITQDEAALAVAVAGGYSANVPTMDCYKEAAAPGAAPRSRSRALGRSRGGGPFRRAPWRQAAARTGR